MSVLIGFVSPVVAHKRLPESEVATDFGDSVAYVAMCVALACCFLFIVMLWTPVYVNGAR